MDRNPIVIADAGPLIRLAAAGLLDSLRVTNRQVVLVDRVEEGVCGDPAKPFAAEVAAWIGRMGPALLRARTVEGAGIEALRAQASTPEAQADLKRKLRHSGERAIREFVEEVGPSDADDMLVVYEDRDVPSLMAAAMAPMTLVTTRGFVRQLAEWGVNTDAEAVLESIRDRYDLKPSIRTRIDAGRLE